MYNYWLFPVSSLIRLRERLVKFFLVDIGDELVIVTYYHNEIFGIPQTPEIEGVHGHSFFMWKFGDIIPFT